MLQYVIRRFLGMIPTLLVLLFVVVGMIRIIPGNIVDLMVQGQLGTKDVTRLAIEHRLGIDRPMPVQYVTYLTGLLHGDLGRSLWTQQPVSQLRW
jgi:ABC-type dipeptide/oligopeptide/nickel transport system permease component